MREDHKSRASLVYELTPLPFVQLRLGAPALGRYSAEYIRQPPHAVPRAARLHVGGARSPLPASRSSSSRPRRERTTLRRAAPAAPPVRSPGAASRRRTARGPHRRRSNRPAMARVGVPVHGRPQRNECGPVLALQRRAGRQPERRPHAVGQHRERLVGLLGQQGVVSEVMAGAAGDTRARRATRVARSHRRRARRATTAPPRSTHSSSRRDGRAWCSWLRQCT